MANVILTIMLGHKSKGLYAQKLAHMTARDDLIGTHVACRV
jgi:hypothetical protein